MRIISGKYKGRQIKTIEGPGYRPAMSRVRESLFSLLLARGIDWGNTSVLDLFAGSGSLGFESLSRGAPSVLFVEKDKRASICLQKNVEFLGVQEESSVITEDVLNYVAKLPRQKFSLVFIDPPYAENFLPRTLSHLLRKNWLEQGAFVVAEVEKYLKIDTASFPELDLELDRKYGQTRIIIWTKQ